MVAQNSDESFDFHATQVCSSQLFSDEAALNTVARKKLINALDKWSTIPDEIKPIWIDLLESAGFYPYIQRLESGDLKNFSVAQMIRKEVHSSDNLPGMYLHEEQKKIADLLMNGENLIVSAPTSFGKSLLIEDSVARKNYKNIVIIQPTLALLDETRRKMKKYSDDYKIIVRTSQQASDTKRNIFLLTAERVMEYPDLPDIDLFIIDEFYKLSAKRDDERSDVLNNAFHLLLGHGAQFYLLGPNIDGISEGFAEKYNAKFIKTDYSLVNNREVDMFTKHKEKFAHPIINKGYKESVLFELLATLVEDQTIIYCSSPERARRLATAFCKYMEAIGLESHASLSVTSWIKDNVHQSWSMINCLERGIGVHDGALPKHLTASVIKYFNENKIKFLFCTSTIIEGVNTSAKNVIFFDSTKGKSHSIDYFDYANIKGRAGRMMVHFEGNIYNFNKPPEKQDVTIDIPFFDQKQVTPEILIHLDKNEIKASSEKEYSKIESIPQLEKQIIKKNGLSVEGQKIAIAQLQQDILEKPDLVLWHGTPTYEQLNYIVSLAWDCFLKPTESTRPFTKNQISYITFQYGMDQDINFLVRNQITYLRSLKKNQGLSDEEIVDEAVRFAFQALRHWFSYKIPKWLLVMDRLQKYVASSKSVRHGDYSYYASLIENDFIRPNLMLLDEFGVPRSAIKKMERYIGEDTQEDQLLLMVQDILASGTGKFTEYEIEKLNELF